MSDFGKKLRKMAKRKANVVAINPDSETLDSISDNFQTVFVYTSTPPLIKKKNIVYREEIHDLFDLPDVCLILSDMEMSKTLIYMKELIRRNKPLIVVHSGEFVHKRIFKWLNEEVHYDLTELSKNWQCWTLRQ
jgi:hypothetical protein